MYPRLTINIRNIICNFFYVKNLCNQNDISLSVVTKLINEDEMILKSLFDNGVDVICQSHFDEIFDINMWQIRSPMLSEIEYVVKNINVSFNSDFEVIKRINKVSINNNVITDIILTIEEGDLREGFLEGELSDIFGKILELSNVKVIGIATNLGCLNGILPDEINMNYFVNYVRMLENKYNYYFDVVSGGSSNCLKLLILGTLPKRINNLRIGETIFLGTIPGMDNLECLYQNNFILECEIVEIKEKDSIPYGDTCLNKDAFNEYVVFDKNNKKIKRALLAIGKKDIYLAGIIPIDNNIKIIGATSDYLVLEVTDTKYKVGDIISFYLDYPTILKLMNDKIYKLYIS